MSNHKESVTKPIPTRIIITDPNDVPLDDQVIELTDGIREAISIQMKESGETNGEAATELFVHQALEAYLADIEQDS